MDSGFLFMYTLGTSSDSSSYWAPVAHLRPGLHYWLPVLVLPIVGIWGMNQWMGAFYFPLPLPLKWLKNKRKTKIPETVEWCSVAFTNFYWGTSAHSCAAVKGGEQAFVESDTLFLGRIVSWELQDSWFHHAGRRVGECNLVECTVTRFFLLGCVLCFQCS